MEIPISIRPLKAEDVPFIIHSWLNTLRYEYPFRYMETPLKSFFSQLQARIKDHMAEIPALVATNTEDDDQIFGYLVYEPGIIHFAYTKEPFRRLKVFKRLQESASPGASVYTTFTRLTPVLFPSLTYNPKLFMEGPHENQKDQMPSVSHV